jgi:PleD family two-component response regulator
VAERYRLYIEALQMVEAPNTQVAVIIGIADAAIDSEKAYKLFKMADRALYRRRTQGETGLLLLNLF